jgi:membrane protein implicated in regulation of membrane protease activity
VSWWIWLIIAVFAGIVEIMSLTFFLLWVAIGSLIGMVLSLFQVSWLWQIICASVATVGLSFFTKPLLKDWKQRKTYVPRVETIVGRRGIAVSIIEPGRMGMVRIDGETWSAVADTTVKTGTPILVREVRSSILVVEPDLKEER